MGLPPKIESLATFPPGIIDCPGFVWQLENVISSFAESNERVRSQSAGVCKYSSQRNYPFLWHLCWKKQHIRCDWALVIVYQSSLVTATDKRIMRDINLVWSGWVGDRKPHATRLGHVFETFRYSMFVQSSPLLRTWLQQPKGRLSEQTTDTYLAHISDIQYQKTSCTSFSDSG